MTENHSSRTNDITCENITNEIIASYTEQGYVQFFAEEVMSYDLSHPLPQINPLVPISYLTWEPQNTHAFYTTYFAAFQERPGFPGLSEEQWVSEISDDPTFRPELSFLATVQGQAVGFITNTEYPLPSTGHNGYIDQMGVLPHRRGHKVGAALLLRSLQAWKQEQRDAVLLHVNINNPQAIRLFQQLGFVVVRRRGKFRLVEY